MPPGTPWNNGHIHSFNNRLRRACLDRNRPHCASHPG
ncbi:MAG: integrase core domain-containing protein [Mycobacterium pseudokansasii]|nr:integrase core domain-containing protein [Mycobacterium pseudokansasii]